jgi:hypothetical protein
MKGLNIKPNVLLRRSGILKLAIVRPCASHIHTAQRFGHQPAQPSRPSSAASQQVLQIVILVSSSEASSPAPLSVALRLTTSHNSNSLFQCWLDRA